MRSTKKVTKKKKNKQTTLYMRKDRVRFLQSYEKVKLPEILAKEKVFSHRMEKSKNFILEMASLAQTVKASVCNAGDLGSIPGFDPWVRKIPWRRKLQPTPVLLPGKSHGQRSLAGSSPWVSKRIVHNLVTKHQQVTDESCLIGEW